MSRVLVLSSAVMAACFATVPGTEVTSSDTIPGATSTGGAAGWGATGITPSGIWATVTGSLGA